MMHNLHGIYIDEEYIVYKKNVLFYIVIYICNTRHYRREGQIAFGRHENFWYAK